MVVSGLLSTPRRAEDLDSHVTHIFAETLKPSEKGRKWSVRFSMIYHILSIQSICLGVCYPMADIIFEIL